MFDFYTPGLEKTNIYIPLRDESTAEQERYLVTKVRTLAGFQNRMLPQILALHLSRREIDHLLNSYNITVDETQKAFREAKGLVVRDGGVRQEELWNSRRALLTTSVAP